jgi:hypothetical protein
LKLVGGHPSFMHGFMVRDARDNPVRVLDVVRGVNFLNYVDSFRMTHETYFWKVLPGILRRLVEAYKAIDFLHAHGFRHGDIRNDHIIVARGGGDYVWIDFDYDFEALENPYSLDLFGLGNPLIYAVGKGFHDYYTIKNDTYMYKDLVDHLTHGRFLIVAHIAPGEFAQTLSLYPNHAEQYPAPFFQRRQCVLRKQPGNHRGPGWLP